MRALTETCRIWAPILLTLSMAGCGGGSGEDISKLTGPSGHTVGGTVRLTYAKKNLNCIAVTLSANGTVIEQINVGYRDGNSVCPIAGQIPSNGAELSFTFTSRLLQALSYRVTVPSGQVAGDQCVVTNGNGVIGSADIADVAITCQ